MGGGWRQVAAIMVAVAAVCAAARAEDDPKKTYDELFAGEERKVLATPTKADDLAFAQKLVTSASGLTDAPRLRAVLYEKACEIASRTPPGHPTAIAALDLLDQEAPDRAGEWRARRLEVLTNQYRLALPAERKDVGERLVAQLLVAGDDAAAGDNWDKAAEHYQRAATTAGYLALPAKDEAGEKLARVEAMKQAEQLKVRLKADPNSANLRMSLLKLYVVSADEPARAAAFLDPSVDEAWRTYVPLAAKDIASLAPQVCLELGGWYRSLAAAGAQRAVCARRAQGYYRQYFLKAAPATAVEKLQLEQTRQAANAALKELGVAPMPRQLTFADPAVRQMLDKAVAGLWAEQTHGGYWSGTSSSYVSSSYNVRATAAAAMALLEAGASPSDPRLAKALSYLNFHNTSQTDGVGVRACLWTAAEAARGGGFQRHIRGDLRTLLIGARDDGTFAPGVIPHYYSSSYRDPHGTAWGHLALAALADNGAKPPAKFWTLARDYWAKSQNSDGGWTSGSSYPSGGPGPRRSRPLNTAAAVAALAACLRQIHGPDSLAAMGGADFGPLRKGIGWLDENVADVLGLRYAYDPSGGCEAYYFLSVCGRMLGRAKFGDTDWPAAGAANLRRRQNDNGCWPGEPVNTAFYILFLVNGARTAEQIPAGPVPSGGAAVAAPAPGVGGAEAEADAARAVARKRIATLSEQLRAKPDSTAIAREIVRLYVVELADPTAAGPFAARAGEPSWPALLAAAARDGDKLAEGECLALGELYRDLTGGASPAGRKSALTRAADCYRRFLELHTTGDAMRLKAQLALEAVNLALKR